jgi:hypothetical protein
LPTASSESDVGTQTVREASGGGRSRALQRTQGKRTPRHCATGTSDTPLERGGEATASLNEAINTGPRGSDAKSSRDFLRVRTSGEPRADESVRVSHPALMAFPHSY